MSFRIAPFPADLAENVRRTRRDGFGQPARVHRDGERHQCRSCLALTDPVESCLLFSFRPFRAVQPYAEAGPVFIHEKACLPYATPEVFPPGMPRAAVVLRAYDENDAIATAAHVGRREIEDVIGELLALPNVRYLHARNDTYGCFICRIERGQGEPAAVAI
jgi:hypothetical protein